MLKEIVGGSKNAVNTAHNFDIEGTKVGARYIGRSIRFREQRSRRNQPPPSDDRGFVRWSCVALAGHGGVTGTLLGST